MLGSITQWLPPGEAYGPVTCDACGCRLVKDEETDAWRHYESLRAGEDARGCRPFCVDSVHDRFGLVAGEPAPA
jgi:hypothetical protein